MSSNLRQIVHNVHGVIAADDDDCEIWYGRERIDARECPNPTDPVMRRVDGIQCSPKAHLDEMIEDEPPEPRASGTDHNDTLRCDQKSEIISRLKRHRGLEAYVLTNFGTRTIGRDSEAVVPEKRGMLGPDKSGRGASVMELLKKLCETDGIAGNEDNLRDIVQGELDPLCAEVRVDRLGSVIGRRGHCGTGDGPAVMLAAHMDEIGFMVSHVDSEKGFVRLNPVGGFDPRTLVAQRVTVHTDEGPLLGVMGTKPVHIMSEADKKKAPNIKRYYVDLGLPTKEIVERVDIGDMVTMRRGFEKIGQSVTSKALDNRAGVYVMLETLRALGKEELGVEVFAVATVQEEVGLRGAQTSAFGVAPDMGIALDVTVASDVPDAKPHEFVSALGKGTAIKLMDGAVICDRRMVKLFRRLALEQGITHQLEILPHGGTDAGAIQRSRSGVRTAALSIPTRYLHSTVEMAHLADIDATIELLTAFLREAHQVA